MSKKNICLVGLGSIGLTHLEHISNKFNDIVIIDKNIKVAAKAKKVLGSKRFYFTTGIKDINRNLGLDYAVIANWGPDHFKTLESLQHLGIKNYIIEKPITDSISDLFRIKQLRDKNSLRIFVNFQWSYSPLLDTIKKTNIKHKLGRLVMINVTGGAKCIATNGIHYLDLSNSLFSANPIQVFSNIYNSEINPRRKDFLFLGGISSWEYLDNRYLNINFSNQSRMSPSMEMIFEFGIGRIHGNNLFIERIDNKNLLKYPSATKTFYGSKEVYKGSAFTFPDNTDGLSLIYKKFIKSNDRNDNFEDSFNSTLDFFGALISNEKGRKILLPLKSSRFSNMNNKKWGIS
jgi:predicted dehydrogenase